MALLSDAQLNSMRATHALGLAVVGVGGASWTVTRSSGDGITGPKTSSAAGTVSGYAYEEQPDKVQLLLAGTRASVQPWRFVLVSGTLQAGDAITSVVDSTIRFTVQQPQPGMLYPTAIIEPLGPPSSISAPGSGPMLDFSQAGNSQYLGAI